jgi:Tol biopolymer transport system component
MKLISILCMAVLAGALAQPATESASDLFQRALLKERTEGNLPEALKLYQRIVVTHGSDRKLAAQALLRMAECHQKLGDAESRRIYERLVREYPDQKEAVAEADLHLRFIDKRPGKETDVVARQIWVGDSLHLGGSPSHDARYFVVPDDKGNVSIRDLKTGETRVVTRDAQQDAYAFHPVLSPDGKQVAYTWGHRSIRVTSVDGSHTRMLFSGESTSVPLAWSPDSKRLLAFLSKGVPGRVEYSFISISDGSLSRVKSFERDTSGSPLYGSISPDGRYVVYSVRSTDANVRGIFAIAADGSREAPLVQSAANDISPFWTPDGKSVVFTSDRSGTVDLWSIRVADGKPQGSPDLLRANVGEIGLGFARDGSYYYGTRTQEDDVYLATIEPESLKVIEQPRRISEKFAGHNLNPEWSPDGQSIAFLRRGAAAQRAGAGVFGGFGIAEVIIQSIVTSEERALAKIQANLFGIPRWFPDGKSLLMADRDPISYMQIDAQTGSARVLAKDLERSTPTVALSHDGKSLFYSSAEGETKSPEVLRLIKRDLASGQETELYRTESLGYGLFEIAVSPDGTRIAFLVNNGTRENDRSLITVPTGGGPARELYRGAYSNPLPNSCAWTRDGRYLLVAAAEGHSVQLRAVPAGSGEVRPLDISMTHLRGPSVSPDGRRIAFTAGRQRDELWVIRNLLPSPQPSR